MILCEIEPEVHVGIFQLSVVFTVGGVSVAEYYIFVFVCA
jgi:hypothetical protein